MSYEPTEWKNGDIITANSLNNIENGVQNMNSEYVPTVWENGDIITAEKLNNIEQGISNGGSSDFSTCKLISSSEGTGDILNAIMVDINESIYIGVISHGYECNVVLYKGEYYLEYDDTDVSISIISGDAELTTYDGAPVIHITGDCEILVNRIL